MKKPTSHTSPVHAVHPTAHHATHAATDETTTSRAIVPKPLSSAAVAEAIAQIDALEANLGLDIVLPPNDRNQSRAMNRVSDAVLNLASDIVTSAPSRFPDFAGITAAASYVNTVRPLADRVATLATHLQNSIQNQRTPAAVHALALYAVVKGLGRVVDNETMREKIPQLKAEIVPRPKTPKPKQTKAEKALKVATKRKAKRVRKALATLAANGIAIPAATATP